MGPDAALEKEISQHHSAGCVRLVYLVNIQTMQLNCSKGRVEQWRCKSKRSVKPSESTGENRRSAATLGQSLL